MSSKNFNSFKDFQSDQLQTSSRKLFTAHHACSNSDLNLTLVTGTTNAFIFQIINSLIESWGVCLTCFDCKTLHSFGKGKTLEVIKIVRKLQWTQEPQDIPTCTGTTLSASNLLLFFSQNLEGRWFTVCIVTNQKLKQQAMKYYDQGLPAAIYMQ